MTCWDEGGKPRCHPLAIVEWKVHRPGRRNRHVDHERKWLRDYCGWQHSVVGYAIAVDGTVKPTTITCARFCGREEQENWLKLSVDPCSPAPGPCRAI